MVQATGKLTVHRQYSGLWRLSGNASVRVKPRMGAVIVIRDRDAYHRFVALIPRNVVRQHQPAPKSKDPLLARPHIDFAKQMLVAAIRRDMHVGPKIQRVVVGKGSINVYVVFGMLAMTINWARQAGIGTYHAVVVPRAAGVLVPRVTVMSEIPLFD